METSGNILTTLLLCGLMGLLGQGVRAAVGLKSSGKIPSAQAGQQTAFSAAYFVLSLMIGFIAGVLAGLIIGVKDLLKIDPTDLKVLLGIAASGYAGADFIENSLSIIIPASNPPASPDSSGSQPSPGSGPSGVNLNAHAFALSSAVQQLSTATNQLASITVPLMPAVITGTVPTFGPALSRVTPSIDRRKWEPALTQGFQKFALTSNQRIAAAIGQFLVEAGDSFDEVVENMSYSAQRMTVVWPSTFKTEADALPYAHQPEKLGNFIYANKLGNGSEASGDGYRFRGRGLFRHAFLY